MTNRVILINLQESLWNPPLGLGYLVSYYEKHRQASDFNIEVQVHSPASSSKSVAKRLRGASLVGISTWTENFNQVLTLCDEIKESLNVPVVLGGHHISALPHTLPPTAEAAVIGEGEQSFLELLEGYSQHGGLDKTWLQGVKGIAYRDGEGVRVTQRRELIKPLDQIPFPARSAMPMHTRGRVGYSYEYKNGTTIMTSRGCPYACVYCSSTQFWGRTIRFHSPQYVIGEIEEIVERYGVKTLCIEDDLFIADRRRLREIVDLICARGINRRVNFELQGRANLMDEEAAQLLKKMNTRLIAFGFESGCERTLRYIKGGNVTVADNRRAKELCKKYGFRCIGTIMIGTPGETREDLLESINFVRDVFLSDPEPNWDLVIVLTVPLPGTEFWNYAKEKGLVNDFMDWNSLGRIDGLSPQGPKAFGDRVFLPDQLSREEAWDLVMPFLREIEKAQGSHYAASFRLRYTPLYFRDFVRRPKTFSHQARKALGYVLRKNVFRR